MSIHEDAGTLLLGPFYYLIASQPTLLREGRNESLLCSRLQDLAKGRKSNEAVSHWESQ